MKKIFEFGAVILGIFAVIGAIVGVVYLANGKKRTVDIDCCADDED